MLVGRFDLVHSLRVLVNLIENAHKYSPADTPIELRVTREDDSIDFAVADRGRACRSARAERIFEPFYRAPGSPPDVGGAGLGLAIARRLAEAQQASSPSSAARRGQHLHPPAPRPPTCRSRRLLSCEFLTPFLARVSPHIATSRVP